MDGFRDAVLHVNDPANHVTHTDPALPESFRKGVFAALVDLQARGVRPEDARAFVAGQFAVAEEVRPGGSWDKAYVDAGFVRAWRLLLDDALMRSLGIPVD